jgi:hypothetical protein
MDDNGKDLFELTTATVEGESDKAFKVRSTFTVTDSKGPREQSYTHWIPKTMIVMEGTRMKIPRWLCQAKAEDIKTYLVQKKGRTDIASVVLRCTEDYTVQ